MKIPSTEKSADPSHRSALQRYCALKVITALAKCSILEFLKAPGID